MNMISIIFVDIARFVYMQILLTEPESSYIYCFVWFYFTYVLFI